MDPPFGNAPAGQLVVTVLMPSDAVIDSGANAESVTPTDWAETVDAAKTAANAVVEQYFMWSRT